MYNVKVVVIAFIVLIACIFLFSIKFLNDNKKRKKLVKRRTKTIKSSTFSCKDNQFLDENGLCRIVHGGPCFVNSECSMDSICMWNSCVERPNPADRNLNLYENTRKLSSASLNRHPMIYDEKGYKIKFLNNSHWRYARCISICDSIFDMTEICEYFLTEHGLFRNTLIDGDHKIESIQVDVVPSKIIKLNGKFYVLSNNSLRVILNEKVNIWNSKVVSTLFGKTFSVIKDISTCEDGSLSVISKSGVYTYTIEKGSWIKEEDDIIKITYGSTCDKIVKHFSDKIVFSFSVFVNGNLNKTSLTLKNNKGEYKDVVINSSNTGIVVILEDSSVLEYIPILNSENNKIYFSDMYKKIPIYGKGENLIRTKRGVWVLTPRIFVKWRLF